MYLGNSPFVTMAVHCEGIQFCPTAGMHNPISAILLTFTCIGFDDLSHEWNWKWSQVSDLTMSIMQLGGVILFVSSSNE